VSRIGGAAMAMAQATILPDPGRLHLLHLSADI